LNDEVDKKDGDLKNVESMLENVLFPNPFGVSDWIFVGYY
jgi:hypothetical protein